MKVMFTGSAPLSPNVHEYMTKLMDCPLIEIYGQTESTAAAIFSKIGD
jgi:long-subunit acyl-CoA synthetase (AMP-forming)